MRTLEACRLCPRCCGVNRMAGARGYCGAGDRIEVYRWAAHDGEEPPVSGRNGSGTVFFSRCTLRCIYCQNYPWSQGGRGERTDAAGLAGMLLDLAGRGCHNWNLVSPTPWVPGIREALETAWAGGESLPVVYNTSGYERRETLEAVEAMVGVYLTDLRYSREETGWEASGANDYVAVARAAIEEMWRQKGPLRLQADGAVLRGVICRVLVLPGHAHEAVETLRWIADRLGTAVPLSLMSQYHPAHRARHDAAWGRPVTRREYDDVCREAERLGFSEGWTQEYAQRTPDDLIGYRMTPAAGRPAGEETIP